MSIEDLEGVLHRHLGPERRIVSNDITNLIPPGENFGGEVLKVDITIEDRKTRSHKVLHVVAKRISERETSQRFFNVQKTFKGEIDFYEKIMPTLQKYQKSCGCEEVINCFADIYGSFQNIDRYLGCNRNEAELILKDLAMLHAVPIALKMNNPEQFQAEIRPKLNNAFPVEKIRNHAFLNGWFLVEEILYESDKCVPFIPQVKLLWDKFKCQEEYKSREPFSTFYHGDLWINNIMLKFENDQAIKSKFIDFQLYDYRSPVLDLLFFLFTSIQTSVLKNQFDHLLIVYYENLIKNLQQLKCDVQPFSYTEFLKEFKHEVHTTLVWCIFFVIAVVYGPKGQRVGEEERFHKVDLSKPSNKDYVRKRIHPQAKERIQYLVQICAKNSWL
ncbi:unnamed protein product [Diabrotica balteata]|uniref:CHK kinase-like domain-containing protein n=1 Tax=Diabrotica balteata TaxID=107213 RepID=A0A9N9XF58_DIABA|nr:unnamed protein product [Diabrotica balteata]